MATFQEKIATVPTLGKMGLEMIEDSAERVCVKMPLAGNSNHVGAAYAGALFTLAEFPFGFLYMNRAGDQADMFPVVGEMSIRYHRPAMGDVLVDVRMDDAEWQSIVETTRAQGKMKIQRETELKDVDGNVVAVATTTYFSIRMG